MASLPTPPCGSAAGGCRWTRGWPGCDPNLHRDGTDNVAVYKNGLDKDQGKEMSHGVAKIKRPGRIRFRYQQAYPILSHR